MSPIQIVFLIIVIIFLFRFLKNYLRFRRMIDLVPGPKVHSILLGNLPEFWNQHSLIKNETTYNKLKHTYLFSMGMFNEYREKGALRIWLGPYCPMIWLTNADNAELLLSSPYNIDKAGFYRFLKPWLGDGLLLAASHIWRPRRKILTSAFHFKILENFLQTFDHHTKHLLKQIDRNTIDGQQQQQPTILIHDIRLIYEDFTMNVINETAMGIELNANTCDAGDDDAANHKDDSGGKIPNLSREKMDSNEDYCMALKQAFRRASNRVLWPINWFDTVFKLTKAGKYFFNTIETINRYSDKVIQKRVGELRTAMEQEAKEAKIFLDILLQHYLSGSQPPISEQSIRSEVNTFILGGHDTTAMALTFSTMLLGQHQDCQEKARQEVEAILSSASLPDVKDDGRDICWTMAQLKSMKYLEMCIKETLRLYPSIQIVGRTLTKPLVLKDGHTTIPPQTQCFIPIFSLHRDEYYFPEPETFNPERFAQPLKHPFAYIPFSAGPRNCIGQKYAMLEIKYVLATLLIKYRILSITNQKDVYPEFSPVFKPCIKIAVKFEPRSYRTDGTI